MLHQLCGRRAAQTRAAATGGSPSPAPPGRAAGRWGPGSHPSPSLFCTAKLRGQLVGWAGRTPVFHSLQEGAEHGVAAPSGSARRPSPGLSLRSPFPTPTPRTCSGPTPPQPWPRPASFHQSPQGGVQAGSFATSPRPSRPIAGQGRPPHLFLGGVLQPGLCQDVARHVACLAAADSSFHHWWPSSSTCRPRHPASPGPHQAPGTTRGPSLPTGQRGFCSPL